MQVSSLGDVEAKLLRSRIRLALRQPFLAGALMRLPIRDASGMSWCSTMATDGYHIFFNSKWVTTLSDPELRGVLAHELMHVLFSHSARCGSRDPERWNIACDYAINLLLVEQGFRLPAGGLMDRSFAGLPAEEIYHRLPQRLSGLESGRGELDEHPEDAVGILAKVGIDLLDPNDPRIMATSGADALDAQQRAELVEELLVDAKRKLQGNSAAWFQTECNAADIGKTDWRVLLRQWLFDRIRSDWSLWPPSKKYIHRGLILPSIGVEAPGNLVFAVDTSGSMTNTELGSIFSEVRSFRETFPCRLTVIQADTEIRSVEVFEEMDGSELPVRSQVFGRGGTDFRCVFNWMELQGLGSAAALVFATDGYGIFPRFPPGSPVIWMRTKSGIPDAKFPFGLVVTLASEDRAITD